jgi:hypothetical protein
VIRRRWAHARPDPYRRTFYLALGVYLGTFALLGAILLGAIR